MKLTQKLKKHPKASKAAILIFGLAISAFCLFLSFAKVNIPKTFHQLQQIDPWAVVVALLLVNIHNFLLAFRWKHLLSPLGKVGYWDAFWSLRLAFFFNAALPARLGEPFRIWFLNRRYKLSPARVIGAMGADRLFDFVTLCVWVYISALILNLRGTLPTTKTIVGGGIAILGIIFVLARLPKTSRHLWLNNILQFHAKLFEGISSLKNPRVLLIALPVSFLGWVIEAAILVTFSYGLDDPFSIYRAFMVVAAVNIAISIPSSPGNIGTFQLGAMTMLIFLNVPKTQAGAIAILYHLIQLVPTTLIGAAGYYFHFVKGRKKTESLSIEEIGEKLEKTAD